MWLCRERVALLLVRTRDIGCPVFATNASRTQVWSATYTPFDSVHTSTGALPPNRFPGQWFQTESGLHQNWMRDYDPTTGRYIQADPLGLIDGASVYGYVGQNPGRWIDPLGLSANPGTFPDDNGTARQRSNECGFEENVQLAGLPKWCTRHVLALFLCVLVDSRPTNPIPPPPRPPATQPAPPPPKGSGPPGPPLGPGP